MQLNATTSAAPPCNCETDPIACLRQMFVDMVQLGRIQKGQDPARRPVFLRLHGVAHGRFEVKPDLPEDLKVGLFGQQPVYPAWVRYSSDLPDGSPVLKSTVGIGIKLFGVEGPKELHPDEIAPTADFTLQNIDVFFVDNATDMCAFTKASLTSPQAGDDWLKDHPETARILKEMEQVVPSVLESSLWSVIPFRFGEGRFCKYKLEPETVPPGPDPDYNDPDYLRADLVGRLKGGEARFRFMVQFQTDPQTMPTDRATVRWDEKASPPVHVATLVLPAQDITVRGQPAYGETLSFNPWRVPAAHRPVGTIADARKVVYRASATLRRNVNGEPLGEPQEPRPDTVWPAPKDTYIVRAAVHPGIGVARIGNSTRDDGLYIGPEVVQPAPAEIESHRDDQGAIKRQAARFRVYGYNAAGEVVRELDADTADVAWTVHLANKKAEWYQFQEALDIPEAKDLSIPRRNANVQAGYRQPLVIDPGPRTIKGPGQSGSAYQFDTGTFMGSPVPLGELRTDELGRLLVLGGRGKSGSPGDTPIFDPAHPSSFNNADGWFDDVSDGPVTAKVTIQGRDIPTDPAWVVVGPPNYAPDVISWCTVYDLLVDAYTECGWLPMPARASFTRDVWPALQRLSNLQWVNKGFAAWFGQGGPMHFEDPALLAKLSQTPNAATGADPYRELRQTIANAFRPADNEANDPRAWPWIYGDAYGSAVDGSPRSNLALSRVRAGLLELWVEGKFTNDWSPAAQQPQSFDQVPLADQPATLDQAALHFCLADAFHPGCELTWPVRHTSMYSAPFRIRHRPADLPVPDYGDNLTQEIALAAGGPLYAQSPGDLTRWMALPWQGDTAFCRSGYEHQYDPYLPTFWPARVPNQVLSQEDYDRVMNESLPLDQRIAAFNNRLQWLRSLTGDPPGQMLQMVAGFGAMGIVVARPGVANHPDLPPVMLVESVPEKPVLVKAAGVMTTLAAPAPAAPPRPAGSLGEAGWESAAQLEAFRRMKRR